MKKPIAVLCAGIAVLCAGPALAQNPQVPQATDTQSSEIAELRQQVEALTKTVQALQQQVKTRDPLAPVFGESTSRSAAGKAVVANEAPPAYTPPKETNLAIFNPEISAAIDVIGSYSHRADTVNLIARDAEIMLQANVDELAHAYAVFNAETGFDPTRKIGTFDEIKLGIEEAAIETTALPYGLKIKAG
ncbi:MAG TPA: hypothetical protein VGO11_17805, partial [Chthoniobacteraceae bacterium]|nr:hypothetical protein [Chthoniobacteraceae bacterium]